MQFLLLNQWFDNPVSGALARTFVHSLWIGLVAAIFAGLVITVTRRSAVVVRYNLLSLLGLLFLGSMVVVFIKELQVARVEAPKIYGNANVDWTRGSQSLINTILQDLMRGLNSYSSLILQIWVVFFVYRTARIIFGINAVNRLKGNNISGVNTEWTIKLRGLKQSLGINRPISLVQSAYLKVPAAIGFLKPVILLPAGLLTQLSPAQVEAILLHELAHIRRNDYIVNILQRFLEAVFFFNPGFIWISTLLRQEREACCDEVALAYSGKQYEYVHALVAFQEYHIRKQSLVLAFSTSRDQLLGRVKRILSRENKTLSHFEKSVLIGVSVIFCAFAISNRTGGNNSQNAEAQAGSLRLLPQGYYYYETDTIPKKGASESRLQHVDSKLPEIKLFKPLIRDPDLRLKDLNPISASTIKIAEGQKEKPISHPVYDPLADSSGRKKPSQLKPLTSVGELKTGKTVVSGEVLLTPYQELNYSVDEVRYSPVKLEYSSLKVEYASVHFESNEVKWEYSPRYDVKEIQEGESDRKLFRNKKGKVFANKKADLFLNKKPALKKAVVSTGKEKAYKSAMQEAPESPSAPPPKKPLPVKQL